MKHSKVVISIVLIAIVGIIIGARYYRTEEAVALPPSDATLAGPQEPLPENDYSPTVPLSKNRIILKNSMKIEVTKEGTGAAIENGQMAIVTYVGKLENGTVFDASKNHGDGSFSFPVGGGRVIKGWDEGVLGMKVGESRTLTIPPALAYGAAGIPGAIPPSATLIFDVTLLAIK